MPTNSISFLVKLLSISQYSLSSSAMDASSLGSPELQDFINQEKQKAMVNEMIGKLTSACWDKCITGTPGSKFSSCLYSCECLNRVMSGEVRQAEINDLC
ncbi:hypothetical protein ACS0TY_030336 [Phlomoides rotata]